MEKENFFWKKRKTVKENILRRKSSFCEKGKGGKYFEKNLSFSEEQKIENEKEENIRTRKIFGQLRRRKRIKMKKEIIWSVEEKENGGGKGGKHLEERKLLRDGTGQVEY